MKLVAEKLRKMREEKGYTQQEVADYIDVSVATISRLESDPTPLKFEYIIRIAQFYDISLRK